MLNPTKNKFEQFTQNDYEILEREVLYQGVFRMVKYTVRYRLYNGDWSNTIMREVMERNSSAAVLPYDPVLDQVILIEQFRTGSISNPQSPWLIEIVAGSFNEGELAPGVAEREAIEEAGCEVLDLFPICDYYVSPGCCNEHISLYCARVDASNSGGIFGLAEEDENILALPVPLEDAFKMLQEGKIKNSPGIITLQWLQLNRNWLKQLWLKK